MLQLVHTHTAFDLRGHVWRTGAQRQGHQPESLAPALSNKDMQLLPWPGPESPCLHNGMSCCYLTIQAKHLLCPRSRAG